MRGARGIIICALVLIGLVKCNNPGGKAGDTPVVPMPTPVFAYPIDIDFQGLPDGVLAGPTEIEGVDVEGDGAVVSNGTIMLNPGELFLTPPDNISEAAIMVNSSTQSSHIAGLDASGAMVVEEFTYTTGDYYFYKISAPSGKISNVQVYGPDSAVERAIFAKTFQFIEFSAGAVIPIADGASDMLVSDLDSDGKTDVAVVDPVGLAVKIAYGNGAGGVLEVETITTSSAPGRVIAADLDGDSLNDLIITLPALNSVAVFINLDGSFDSEIAYPAGNAPEAVASADVNGDGAQDIAVAGSGGVGLLINTNTDGSLAAFQPIPGLEQAASELALADMDLDGDADLVIGTVSPNSLQIVLGDGAGSFSTPATQTVSLGAQLIKTLAVRTLDWDRYPDVAITLTSSPSYKSYINLKNGTLGASLQSFPPVSGTVADHAIGDINADGFADMAFADSTSGNISLFASLLTGDIQPVSSLIDGSSPAAIGIGDIDGDNKNDIVVCDSAGTVRIYLNASH